MYRDARAGRLADVGGEPPSDAGKFGSGAGNRAGVVSKRTVAPTSFGHSYVISDGNSAAAVRHA